MNASNKYGHQVRVSEREAGVIAYALFWAAQYMPEHRELYKRYYDKYARVYQVLTYKKNHHGH